MARILLMEDDAEQARLLGIGLTRADHEVTIAHSGSEAWEYLTTEPFDVLLTDMLVQTPNGDSKGEGGLSLIGRIRGVRVKDKTDPLGNIRIIAISGATAIAEQSLNLAFQLGADICLFKPARIKEILAAIEPEDPQPRMEQYDDA